MIDINSINPVNVIFFTAILLFFSGLFEIGKIQGQPFGLFRENSKKIISPPLIFYPLIKGRKHHLIRLLEKTLAIFYYKKRK